MLGIQSRITLSVISVMGICTIYAPSPKVVTDARCDVEHVKYTHVETLFSSMEGDFSMNGIH